MYDADAPSNKDRRHDDVARFYNFNWPPVASSNTMKQKVYRPSLNDVERISLGKGAHKRGTGSYYVPHRLNADERQLYNQAKEKNYLVIRGTAYRRRRKGSPVCNTFRQRCDALEQLCVVIEKDASNGDRIKIDFSTLRVRDDTHHVLQICNLLNDKYPGLMDNTTNYCTDAKQIEWEVLQNKAIWNVEPRLLIVEPVDRAVAKNIAQDVLKERFADIEVSTIQPCDESDCGAILVDQSLDDAEGASASESGMKNATEIDEIDWNDI